MKNVVLVLVALSALTFGACSKNDGNNSTPAAVPATACGTGIPSQYCTAYNPNSYPNYPYGSGGYYPYGASGYGIPYYGGSGYGCPYGYQPLYTGGYYGSQYTCVQYNYMSSFGYNSYYPSNYAWGTGYVGYGPAQMCDTYVAGSCGADPTLYCMPSFGTRYGYCVRH
jgi:hypothetical protein